MRSVLLNFSSRPSVATLALGLESDHPLPWCGGCGKAHLLEVLKTANHQAADLRIRAAGILGSKIDIPGLFRRQSDLPVEPRPSFRRDFPLQRIADLVLRFWTQFDRDQFLGA